MSLLATFRRTKVCNLLANKKQREHELKSKQQETYFYITQFQKSTTLFRLKTEHEGNK
jgi:hypothetical protein